METHRTPLLNLVSDVLGISVAEVPKQLVYSCKKQDLARAITLRNTVFVLEKHLRGETIRRSDAPWHAQFKGLSGRLAMIATLKRTGYLEGAIN